MLDICYFYFHLQCIKCTHTLSPGSDPQAWPFQPVYGAFPTWKSFMRQMYRMFAPPNQAYRVRSRFLAFRQGKKEISDYVQEFRTLLAAMHLIYLAEEVNDTIFIEGLRTGVARTKVFCLHPQTFEKAVDVTLNAEFIFMAARYGTQC